MSATAQHPSSPVHVGPEYYDRPQVASRYVRRFDHDGPAEVLLALENVHCASCVFRIEQGLADAAGIESVHVTPVSGRAVVRFDPRRLALSTLLRTLDTLGFPARPVAPGAVPVDTGRDERRAALGRLGVAGLGMMQVMMFSIGQYLGAFQGIDPAIYRLLGLVSLVVATPVVFYSGQTFFASAWRGLRSGLLGMDVPVAIAIALAYGWSVWVMMGPASLVPAAAHTYFDSVVMLIFLLLLGRFVEMTVRHQAGERRDALARLLPNTVRLLDEDGTESVVERDALRVGDRVRLAAGEAVPADGEVLAGRGEFDEAMLTGETLPQLHATGGRVFGGTVLVNGSVDLRVAAVGDGSVLAQIERLMDRAQAERPPLAGLADRIARWFVLALILVATAVGAVWWHLDPARMLPVVLSVLVVTCPCALSLATPAALAAATAALARRGLLITRTSVVETLARVRRAVFDKTGTLTLARPALRRVVVLSARADEADALSLAAALESHSRHPLAAAFLPWRDGRAAQDVDTEVGQGIEGTVAGRRLRIGSADYVTALTAPPGPGAAGDAPCASASAPAAAAPSAAAQAALTPGGAARAACALSIDEAPDGHIDVWLGDADGPLARFWLEDSPRPDAAAALQGLRARGIESVIASGDGEGAVRAMATRLHVADARWRQRPADKLALLRDLQRGGDPVVMVGDGINDAPVLAGADVSIALADGADLARVSADMVLLGDSLVPIAEAVDHARRTVRVIRQNLAWAAGYNLIALPLAAAGLIAPWMAAIGMSASSLVVVGNALRLRRAQPAAGDVVSQGAEARRRAAAASGSAAFGG